MNNRFKFRLYEKKIKEMIYADNKTQNNINIINYLIYSNNAFIDWDIENYALMQCTGLKDKNDKLIYEGDIVKNHGWWDASGPAGYEKDTCVVEFDKSVCGFTPMCNYDCDCCIYHEAKDLEVIGNIYENEDLLKCENQ